MPFVIIFTFVYYRLVAPSSLLSCITSASCMLCEAVVLYNLLIMVFPVYVNSRQWLILYSSIGWGECAEDVCI